MAILTNHVLLCLLVVGATEEKTFDPQKNMLSCITSAFLGQWDPGVRALINNITVTVDKNTGSIRAEPRFDHLSHLPVLAGAQKVFDLLLERMLTTGTFDRIKIESDGASLVFTPFSSDSKK